MAKKKAVSSSTKIRVARVPKRCDGYAILNSLVGHIAVMNPDGTILFTNEAWNRFASENGNPPLRAASPGTNYLEIGSEQCPTESLERRQSCPASKTY